MRRVSLCLWPPDPLGALLTQNQYLAPSTQQVEQSWLNTRAESEACQSIFLKLTKDEKQLNKTWNLPGATRQIRIYGWKANLNDI
jgi:hypothetical protein